MAWRLGTWLGVCLLVSASAVVPPPENLHMHSLNFKNILRWKSPAFPRGNLTFTVQYHSYHKSFQDQCSHINLTECDFSNLSKYGNYTLRVQAEFQAEHSEWVTTVFCPVDDTVIGPPGLKLKALGNSLHVLFLVPQVENEPDSWSMKNFYNDWAYNLEYWRNGSDEKFLVKCEYDSEVLKGLEPWTTYCVRVQAFLPE
ncbi:interleukin-10 receptor subunit beta [Sorex araneus]|uniref:interleukin-10 receptor subunit beta n=1 Tax=Sorex araneus TaxID=42254 RepID=UPI002433C334|nr:interleukin-10 receptor subunit beta [Sorex araneus]